MARIVIALGGNALGNTPQEQEKKIAEAVPSLVDLISQGHEIILSHGNGPQVGYIEKKLNASADGESTAYFLPECTAMSQGYIGYHLQKGILEELHRRGMPWHVTTVITQVEVDAADEAFSTPSKPIGNFYSKEQAHRLMAKDKHLVMKEDAGRGFRKYVASPLPLDIVEKDSILNLLDNEFIVIACGGGGIPVIKKSSLTYCGVEAVIDKDFASAKLAELVEADYFFILTAVDRVLLNYGTKDQTEIVEMNAQQGEKYMREGHFAPGSMLPKVKAALAFAKSKKGRKAVIASLEKAPLAMSGASGTVICD